MECTPPQTALRNIWFLSFLTVTTLHKWVQYPGLDFLSEMTKLFVSHHQSRSSGLKQKCTELARMLFKRQL